MKRSELTEKILDIKREKGWTWAHIVGEIGEMSPVLIVGALLGNMKLTKPQAEKAGKLFGLSPAETKMLNEVGRKAARLGWLGQAGFSGVSASGPARDRQCSRAGAVWRQASQGQAVERRGAGRVRGGR